MWRCHGARETRRWFVGALLAWCCAIAGCSGEVPADTRLAVGRYVSGEMDDQPFVLTLRRPQPLAIGNTEIASIRRLSHPLEEGMTASLALHVLHAHGLQAVFDNPQLPTGADLLQLFTDDRRGRAFFGEPAIIKSRYGIRCAVSPNEITAREYHRDQALAVFAEMGLSLSTPFLVGGETLPLRDLLVDSIANYSSRQEELDWTALAYALYLPPITSWQNKYGETFTFDDMTDTLLNRPLNSGSCSGSHLAWAMIAIARVDQESTPILSDPVRKRLWARLRQIVRAAQETQGAEGTWGTDWSLALLPTEAANHGLSDHHTLAHELLVTSHIAEWCMHLPQELTVPDEVVQRAGRWLFRQWRRVGDSDHGKDFVAKNFCPCSHAAVVLGALCEGEEHK
jgi:hypothetical protein